MLDLLSDLGRRAAAALATHLAATGGAVDGLPAELPVVRAGKPEFGDFQISACLQIAKQAKRPPRELAEAVVRGLTGHEALAKIEIAGPGFVNLHLTDGWLANRVAARMSDPRLGLRPVGRDQRVVIDYSAPNVAKPMHIGHIRSTIVGAALHRTLKALAYDVIADNHIGDWGTQFGKLIVAYRRWNDQAAYAADPVTELLRLYVAFSVEEKRERGEVAATATATATATEPATDEEEVQGPAPPILEEARRELVKLQAGDAENHALWQKFIADSRHAFQEIYDRLGVTFDYWLGESTYNGLLPTVVQELRRRGIARDSRGAQVIFFDEQGEVLAAERAPIENAKLPPFIVQKSDGGFNYASTDVATLAIRLGLFGASRILIVTDERQQLHFRQLFAVARRMGVTVPVEHIWFGLMRMAEGTIKTREGNVIHLADLLDEAERRATVAAGEHNPELGDEERRDVGRVVGIGAVKYNDLSKDRQTLVTFTFDKALSLQGNTAPYLQYAYARIRSIVRKSGEAPSPSATVILGDTVERDLARRILAYPEAVETVARTCRPHVLCDYLYELATAFSTFYADHPVLKAEPTLRASRLVLTELTARVLRDGLSLLGIDVLERM
ncbi:MAG: arginine--tRNA ligase [Myxococcales bacterium]|nr:arginine--tRNA ligase [Myxococcales bacterium]